MYGLVPYNISPIQQAIQYGHAVVEYGLKFFNEGEYQDWAKYCKTFMVLNGGTSNHTQDRYRGLKNDAGFWGIVDGNYSGTMEKNLSELTLNEIKIATFYEPDLNDMLSAIVFLVDERVFDREKYPDFDLKSIYGEYKLKYSEIYEDPMDPKFPNLYNLMGSEVRTSWNDWVESIGGRKNLFLRVFLKNFRLA